VIRRPGKPLVFGLVLAALSALLALTVAETRTPATAADDAEQ
jgi:hypothetical protein